jgi:hypothetical protein
MLFFYLKQFDSTQFLQRTYKFLKFKLEHKKAVKILRRRLVKALVECELSKHPVCRSVGTLCSPGAH